MQDWINLANNEGTVRITVEHWLTPNGRQINGAGLTPDIVVEIPQADITAGKDPQLDRAIQAVLTGK